MDLLVYFGKVNVYWILFYACYWLLFRKHTFFVWNRFYLLGTLLISFALPSIHFPDSARVIPTAVYAVSAIPVYVARPESAKTITHWTQFVWIIQLIGCSLMLFKLMEGFKDLFKLIRQGEAIPMEDHTLVLLPHNEIGSFSFLKWLVVNFADYENHFDPILRHESVHIRQRHSLDILLIESLKVIFWFNPVLWFYKKSLQEVHEFLADEEVPNRDHYARFLVAYALNAPVASLTNHFFNSSLLKSRIKMIYKNRNSQWALGKYLLIFPVIGIFVMLTAARERLLIAIERNQFEILSRAKMSVSGRVRDEDGNSIESASVVAKGKGNGTITDMYGRFEISDLTSLDSLVISHINYESVLVSIKSTELDFIILRRKDNTLEKIVTTPRKNALPSETPASRSDEFVTVQEMPKFPGGENSLNQFLFDNIVYSSEAMDEGVQGEVGVSFIINEKGYIRDPKIVKGIGYGLDEETLRVVLKMPRWAPGRQGGKSIAVKYNLNVSFSMEGNKQKRQGSNLKTAESADYSRETKTLNPGLNYKNYAAGKVSEQTNNNTTTHGIQMAPDKGISNFKSAKSIFSQEHHLASNENDCEPAWHKKLTPKEDKNLRAVKDETTFYVTTPTGKIPVYILKAKKK